MSGTVEALNRAAAAWWEWTLASTGQGALLLLLVLAILTAGRSLRPGLRYGLLLVVLLKFAVPPVFGVAYGFSDLLARAFTNEPAPLVNSDLRVTVETSSAPSIPSPTVPVATFRPQVPVLSTKAWLLLLEAAGAAVIVFLIARQCLVARTLIWNGAVAEETLQERFHAMARALKLRRTPRLCMSEAVGAPQSGGILRPFIILPAWAATMPEDELDILLAHELAHVRRMDALVNGFQAAAQALLWWNPAVWWLNRRIREEREFCCDDLVLSQGIASGAAYSRTLVNVAERVSLPQSSWAMAGMADNFGAIDRRVRRALEGGHAKRGWGRYGAFVVLMVVAGWVLPGATDGAEQREHISVETTVTLRVAGGVDVRIRGERTEHRQKPDVWSGAVLEGDVRIEIEGVTIVARRVEFGEDLSAIRFYSAALESKDFGTVQAEQILVDPVARRLDILNGTVDEAHLKAAFGESAKNAAKGEWLTLPFAVVRPIEVNAMIVEVDRDADIVVTNGLRLARIIEERRIVITEDSKGTKWETFQAALQELVKKGEANVVARPGLSTNEGEAATIEVGAVTGEQEGAGVKFGVTTRLLTKSGKVGGLECEVRYSRATPSTETRFNEPEINSTFRFTGNYSNAWGVQVVDRPGDRVELIVIRPELLESSSTPVKN